MMKMRKSHSVNQLTHEKKDFNIKTNSNKHKPPTKSSTINEYPCGRSK